MKDFLTDGRVQRRVQPREVRGDQYGMRERYTLSYRVVENIDILQSRDEPLFVVESGLLRDGFSIPGLAHIRPEDGAALHAAFSGAGMQLHDLTVEIDERTKIDERTRHWTYTFDFTVFRPRTTLAAAPANPPAPKPAKVISPFSIGLGQRSIEV